jgi:hypothetical protein
MPVFYYYYTEIVTNYPLMAAISAVIIAQVLKLPVQLITDGKVEISRIFSTGGMPSSHSAFVSALTTALALTYGLGHPIFALSLVFSLITMYDAAGIRRQAGKHAMLLNIIVQEMGIVMRGLAGLLPAPLGKKEKLKEMLGHEPTEVLGGAVLGILMGFWLYRYF